MEYLSIEEVSDRLSQVEAVLREHTEDKEAHEAATFAHSGFLTAFLNRQLYADGLRYKGLTSADEGRYTLEKMSFGNYIGSVKIFSDYPSGETDQPEDVVAVKIEGYGEMIDLPSQENNYGSNTVTDSGLYRHITIINISQGRRFEKYIGGIYNKKKNYGWVCSGHWEAGNILVGSGLLKARRFFDGGALDIELVADIESLNLKNGAGFAKIGELPDGYTLNPGRTTYFTAFGQNPSTNTIFSAPIFINNYGKDINVAVNQDIDIVKFRIKSSAFTDGPINL
ncbi:hypothetical protein [Leuconostoc suionicum]|uniref:hypothetical protein n=1 Tax=Leuconostoc suionicum TaxID=1511761 RepID=UPI0028D24CC5|nr:hypothetical protein [Leuconostoc suionicum]